MLSTFVILILAAIGGSMVPRFLMPPWLQELGWWTPHAWVIDAYQGLLWRDAGVADLLDHPARLFHLAEQPAALEVAVEGLAQHETDVPVVRAGEVGPFRTAADRGLEQVERLHQVTLERLAQAFAGRGSVLVEVGVQHEGDVPGPWRPGLGERLAVRDADRVQRRSVLVVCVNACQILCDQVVGRDNSRCQRPL